MAQKPGHANGPQKFGSWYERRRKEINDNVGLIIALSAAGAAIWSGYVAQKAREESKAAADTAIGLQEKSFTEQLKSARDSLRIQQGSVDAQIKSMVLDERPYIMVDYDRVEMHSNEDEVYIKITALGRTPPVGITLDIRCTELGEPSSKTFRRDAVEANALFVYSGQSFYPLVDCHRDPNEKQTGELLTEGWAYGVVRYQDIFKKLHYTKFCFNFLPSKRNPKDFEFCHDFKIEIM
jgi:hypothetical protein